MRLITLYTDSGCETRRQLALKMTRVDDVYVPDCTDEGLYAKVQCESKGRVCWCVDEDTGDVIEGTRSDGGPNDVNCQPYSGELKWHVLSVTSSVVFR